MAKPPHNFSWITPNIAGSGYPMQDGNFDFYREKGISVIINLTEKLDYLDQSKGITVHHFPITDFTTPSKTAASDILQTIEDHLQKNEKIVVHCMAGCGRTGTILGLWMAAQKDEMSRERIIEELRNMRPCSLENEDQYDFVMNFDFNS